MAKATQHNYKNLVLEGSGIRAFAYAGAMAALDEKGVLNRIQRVGGTSGGSIIATLWTVGYTPQEMIELADDVPADAFNDSRWKPWLGFYKLKNSFGYHNGVEFTRWLSELIKDKTDDANITFRALRKRNQNRRDLYIVTTDVMHQKVVVLSHENVPDMKVKDAVRASIAIPLYFTPVPIDKEGKVLNSTTDKDVWAVLNDGGMLANYPIQLFDAVRFYKEDSRSNKIYRNPATLGLNLEAPRFIHQNLDITTLTDYFKMVYHTMIDKPVPEEEKDRTIVIDDLDLSPRVKQLDKRTIQALVKSGREAVEIFWNQD